MVTFDQLKAGGFYIPVFERIEPSGAAFPERYRTDAPLYRYLGDGKFETETGDSVDFFYDPELGLNVALDAPDGFIH